MSLSWEDSQLLATLAMEQADNRRLSSDSRERWFQIGERVAEERPTAVDLREVAKLARADAALQRDAGTKGRYRALADRADAAAAPR